MRFVNPNKSQEIHNFLSLFILLLFLEYPYKMSINFFQADEQILFFKFTEQIDSFTKFTILRGHLILIKTYQEWNSIFFYKCFIRLRNLISISSQLRKKYFNFQRGFSFTIKIWFSITIYNFLFLKHYLEFCLRRFLLMLLLLYSPSCCWSFYFCFLLLLFESV